MPTIETWRQLQLPKALKEQKAWTLSDGQKKPLDVRYLNRRTPYGWSPRYHSPLLTYSEIIDVLEKHSGKDYLPSIRLSPKLGYLIVDIEPEGMPDNKYEAWPYVYAEYSKNGGYHGILPFQPDDQTIYDQTVIVDQENQTELMLNNHFLTFTAKTIPLENLPKRVALSTSKTFQRKLEVYLKQFIRPVKEHFKGVSDYETFFNQPLTPLTRGLYAQGLALLKPLKPQTLLQSAKDHDEENTPSHLEYRHYLTMAYFYLGKAPQLTLEELAPLVYQTAQHLTPKREKQDTTFHSSKYGEIKYQEYDILNAINYALTYRQTT